METYKFLGVLSNAFGSVHLVDFGPRVAVKRYSANRLVSLLSEIEGLPEFEVESSLDMAHYCLNDAGKYAYVLTSSIRVPPEEPTAESILHGHLARAERRLLQQIQERLKLMRLFKDGAIDLVAWYVYQLKDKAVDPQSYSTTPAPSLYRPYTVHVDEATELNRFLNRWRIPFGKAYLDLAHAQFEQSYEARSMQLEFLSLMIALEVLFNPGPQELRYRISRQTAIVLGTKIAESEAIFRSVQALYDKRSLLVHSGKAEKLTDQDVTTLRGYIRRSIIRLAEWDISKEEMVRRTNQLGFGQAIT